MRSILFAFLLSLSPVFAGWQDLDKLYENLKKVGLDKIQDEKIETLFKNYHYELKNWWKIDQKIHNELFKSFKTDSFITSKIDENLKETYKEKAVLDWKFFQKLYGILTQEQRQQFIQNLNKE